MTKFFVLSKKFTSRKPCLITQTENLYEVTWILRSTTFTLTLCRNSLQVQNIASQLVVHIVTTDL